MNIPQIPDIEEIKRKMAEANMNFPEPVSYQDQLQAIRDLPPMTKCPQEKKYKRQCKICQRQLLPLQACQSLICHKCNPLGFLNK
jgi:hypothetical protein